MISRFGSTVLSKEQMKKVKGGKERLNEDACSYHCSKSGYCVTSAKGNGCECSVSDGGTC